MIHSPKKIAQVAVYGRIFKEEIIQEIQEFFDALASYNIGVKVYTDFYQKMLGKIEFPASISCFSTSQEVEGSDFFFSLGGDGTILSSILFVKNTDIPVVGINTGHLGFLSSTHKNGIKEIIHSLVVGCYTIEKRSLIGITSTAPLFDDYNKALNEFSIIKKDSSSMIQIKAYVNNHLLNAYWADGLIVATPTGSTGYSLSCGGPIVMPDANVFVITPIAPHNLTVRPIVIPDTSKIKLEVVNMQQNYLISLDARSKTMEAPAEIVLTKDDAQIHLVRIHDMSFFSALRNKLWWGMDKRN